MVHETGVVAREPDGGESEPNGERLGRTLTQLTSRLLADAEDDARAAAQRLLVGLPPNGRGQLLGVPERLFRQSARAALAAANSDDLR